MLWRRQPAAPVGLAQPAVDDQVGPASPRPGPVADPRIGGTNEAATPTPLPGGNESSPKVFEYPELRVITEPAGARVTVDGVGWGQSPLTIRALPAGARLVRVTLDGYAAQERHVAVAGDTPRTTVRITLKPFVEEEGVGGDDPFRHLAFVDGKADEHGDEGQTCRSPRDMMIG